MSALLPPSATPMMHAVVDAVEAFIDRNRPPTLLDPAHVDPSVLPYLAWSLGVPVWRDGWPTSVKRAVVAGAIARARRFGTLGSYRRTLRDFQADADLEERWDGHHTLRIALRNANQVAGEVTDLSEALRITGRGSVVLTIEASGAGAAAVYVAPALAPVAVGPFIRSYEEN